MFVRSISLALFSALAACPQAITGQQLIDAVQGVSKAAEEFARLAPHSLSTESLHQRVHIGQRDFHVRNVVSEYSCAVVSGALHEIRKVVEVDGRPVLARETARRTLFMDARSADDAVKRRLLAEFERHGLIGAATDFGLSILLFRASSLNQYHFSAAGESFIGVDRVLAVRFTQTPDATSGGMTVFTSRKASRSPLEGTVFVRITDWSPVRMTLSSVTIQDKIKYTEFGAIDYAPAGSGSVMPTAVLHRESINNKLWIENHFIYSTFRRFKAESDVQFEITEP